MAFAPGRAEWVLIRFGGMGGVGEPLPTVAAL
jgi:hypothetical protein